MTQTCSDRPKPVVLLLVVLLLIRAGLGVAYSLATPLGEAPDEADHFAYAAYILEHRSLPVGPEMTQGKHPPLYYLAAAWAGGLAGGSGDRSFLRANPDMAFGTDSQASNFFVHTSLEARPWRAGVLTMRAGRFVSMLAGLILVLATYLLGRALWPGHPSIALGGAAFAALLPESLFVGGAMSNDMFAAMWSALTLLGTARLLRRPGQVLLTFFTGLCLGFAFVSKASTGSLALVIVAALLLHSWRASAGKPSDARRCAEVAGRIALIGAAAFVVAAPWLWRNWRLYGDPFGWSIVLATIDRRTVPFAFADVVQLLRGWWLSFWGKFGGAGHIPLPLPFYIVWLGLGVGAVAGWIAHLTQGGDREVLREPGAGGWTLLLGAPLVAAAGIYSYSQTALGTDQGRLLFPALAPIALLIFAGLAAWFPRVPTGWASGFGMGMAAVAASALVWGLVPPFAPPSAPSSSQVEDATPANVRIGPLQLKSVAWNTPAPGQLTLYWQATEQPRDDLRTDLRVFDASGSLLWEWKRSPGAGRFSTDRWPAGRIVADTYRVPASDLQRSTSVQVGLRPFPEGPWLPIAGTPDAQFYTLPE